MRRWILAPAMLGATVLAFPLFLATPRPAIEPVYGIAKDDPERQAALVAAQDRWLNQVRAVTAVAPLKALKEKKPEEMLKWTKPYRLETTAGYTLVLTKRSQPYTIADLLRLAPQTFTRQPQGSYLLTENIYVCTGATLKLFNPGGLDLRLASKSDGFVAVVSLGGLILEGTSKAPLKITSWDPRTGKPDTEVNDGRAYLRAIGGRFSMAHTRVSDLGFWSGRTGGISLTGTDRPNTGAIEGPTAPAHYAKKVGNGEVRTMPDGALAAPDGHFTMPGLSYVSGRVSHCTIIGNAYGLFISGANGISIGDTTVRNSFEHGVILHRFATNAIIERTVSRNNHGDGFVLSRATQQVRFLDATAEGNGGNGFTLSGQPLADGPSSSGESVVSYGSNLVSHSVARNNGHYGVEILGGLTVRVQDSQVEGSDMGIVVRRGAENVTIVSNHLRGQVRQGIALRDGVRGATVAANVIESAETGIYIRDSTVGVRDNTIRDASSHGITFVGGVSGSSATNNVIDGAGPSAVDVNRATGMVLVKDNQTAGWFDTTSFWIKVRHYASPMTLLWTSILMLILVLAVRRRHTGRRSSGMHPYADKLPLPSSGAREIARGRARVAVMAD